MARNDLISADAAHDHVQGGSALLVCAYDSDDKFRKFHLEGAMPLSELKMKGDELNPDQEIIFYCA